LGERADRTGGGLVRSSGGWFTIKAARKDNVHLKSDERIVLDKGYQLLDG
jgi:putative transposase